MVAGSNPAGCTTKNDLVETRSFLVVRAGKPRKLSVLTLCSIPLQAGKPAELNVLAPCSTPLRAAKLQLEQLSEFSAIIIQ